MGKLTEEYNHNSKDRKEKKGEKRYNLDKRKQIRQWWRGAQTGDSRQDTGQEINVKEENYGGWTKGYQNKKKVTGMTNDGQRVHVMKEGEIDDNKLVKHSNYEEVIKENRGEKWL